MYINNKNDVHMELFIDLRLVHNEKQYPLIYLYTVRMYMRVQ